jgi:hypothetical protein
MNSWLAKAVTLATAFALASSIGCSSGDAPGAGDDELDGNGNKDGTGADGENGAVECTNKPASRAYVGFGKTDLVADRPNEATGMNRARVKPFSVLAGEYTRTIGAAPASLAGSASTFGDAKTRWFEESSSGALELDQTFRVSFQGCLEFTKSAAEYGAAPTDDTAKKNCTTLIRKFWSADGASDEIEACTQYAMTGSAKENNPRRRWAYVCASVLSSSRFLTF